MYENKFSPMARTRSAWCSMPIGAALYSHRCVQRARARLRGISALDSKQSPSAPSPTHATSISFCLHHWKKGLLRFGCGSLKKHFLFAYSPTNGIFILFINIFFSLRLARNSLYYYPCLTVYFYKKL